ncbi:hypothetical protein NDU88_003997 [Pleurodeles waltl]|uniref:ribonuclease H n=1 Tax=Pleurodeles waltl TaxID=8319 RepID=A0AAV7M7X4_PLEWA|nr:hypothetical protein NDU88_003997 [Pleurodeles waltl]
MLKYFRATIRCSPEGVRGILNDNHPVMERVCLVKEDIALASLPSNLWATSDTDVGQMIIPLVHISVKEGAVLQRLPQYKISQEGEEALTRIVHDLIAVGVVEEVLYNVCNSPILPILKKDTDTRIYRFIIDLREVNKIVIPQYPVVSDITTLLTLVPPTANTFSVIDLKNAFFSIPIHPDSRYL